MIEVVEIDNYTGKRTTMYINPDKILLIEELDKDLYFSKCPKDTRPVPDEIISRVSFGERDGHILVCHAPDTVAQAIVQSKARTSVVQASDD